MTTTPIRPAGPPTAPPATDATPPPLATVPAATTVTPSDTVLSLRCAGGHTCGDATEWRCPQCRRPWELVAPQPFRPAAIDPPAWSLWRYAAMLPVAGAVTLGEGGTPLVPVRVPEGEFTAKLEFLAPTGSYKDRGTALVVNHLLAAGVREVVEDSSGNAGASLAAYAAAAGIRATVYVPASASTAKKRQIAGHGATVVEVPGDRSATARAARRHGGDAVYASHYWSPLFLRGQATCAWELWEQLGRRAPDAVVCPVGQGNLLLGMARGFAALRDAGLVAAVPRMFAAQSAACAPIALAWQAGSEHPVPTDIGPTVAEGILSARPVRGHEILRTLRDTGGGAITVTDDATLTARHNLRSVGLSVEPTSAVAVAALPHLRTHLPGVEIVIPLTGTGLKSPH